MHSHDPLELDPNYKAYAKLSVVGVPADSIGAKLMREGVDVATVRLRSAPSSSSSPPPPIVTLHTLSPPCQLKKFQQLSEFRRRVGEPTPRSPPPPVRSQPQQQPPSPRGRQQQQTSGGGGGGERRGTETRRGGGGSYAAAAARLQGNDRVTGLPPSHGRARAPAAPALGSYMCAMPIFPLNSIC